VKVWFAAPSHLFWLQEPELDLRPGGRYRFTVGDGTKVWSIHGSYLEGVEPPARLVFTWLWENDPTRGDSGDTVVTVEFFDRGGRTEVVLTHDGFASELVQGEHDHGGHDPRGRGHLRAALGVPCGAASPAAERAAVRGVVDTVRSRRPPDPPPARERRTDRPRPDRPCRRGDPRCRRGCGRSRGAGRHSPGSPGGRTRPGFGEYPLLDHHGICHDPSCAAGLSDDSGGHQRGQRDGEHEHLPHLEPPGIGRSRRSDQQQDSP
jgi:uncharacterized protein YndB with AHSA1/START domain